MKYILYFVFIITSSLVSSCGMNRVDYSKIEEVSKQELKGKISYLFNVDSTSVICIGNKKRLEQGYSFFVYSVEHHKKSSDIYSNVNFVEWKDIQTINYSFLPGTIKINETEKNYRTLLIKP